MCALRGLIDIRDGYNKCNGLTCNNEDEFILRLYRVKAYFNIV